MRHRIHFRALAIAILFLGVNAQLGCSRSTPDVVDVEPEATTSKAAALSTSTAVVEPPAIVEPPPMAEPAGYEFADPVRLKAGDEFVSVESPGYACPTLADVDGDGKEDLVVGQFKSGHMQFCKNVAAKGEQPEFAAAEWIMTGDERAQVPGVW